MPVTLFSGQSAKVDPKDLLGSDPAGPVELAMDVAHASTFAASLGADAKVHFLGRNPGKGLLVVLHGDQKSEVEVTVAAPPNPVSPGN